MDSDSTTSSSPSRTINVKTLDGVNREFTPPEGMTVQGFKAMIEESVGISADVQRLIFRGKVLQDDKTLDEYDIRGNTLHLVQRAPGTPNTLPQPEPRDRSESNSPDDIGGAFILGSIGHLDLPNGNPAPRRNSAAIRLQVANEMINRASNLLLRLEEEEEEAMEAAAAAAAESPPVSGTGNADTTTSSNRPTPNPNNLMSQLANAASAAALVATVSHSHAMPSDNNNTTTTGSRQPRNPTGPPQPPPEAPRVRELATGLQDVLALQERLTPFLRLVLNVLRENRQYSSSAAPQFIYDTVSAAIHAVSHSLHALSDITVDFGVSPDSRRLRAPASILMEQSTVLRATIPISVQAGMQLPGNLQNMVNAAAAASFGQGFRQFQGPTPPAANTNNNNQGQGAATAQTTTAASNPNPTSATNSNTPPVSTPPPNPQQQPPPTPNQNGQAAGMGQFPDFLFGPGGILSNDGSGGGGEIYDILLSCHSHHSNARRAPRPENLSDHLDVTGIDDARGTYSASAQLEIFLQILSSVELFQGGLRDIVSGYLLRGRNPSNEGHVLTWAKGVAKKLMQWVLQSAGRELQRNPEIDLPATLGTIFTSCLTRLIDLVMTGDTPRAFRLSTIRLLEETAHKFLVAIKATYPLHLSAKFLRELIDATLVGSSLSLRRELVYSLVQYMETSVAKSGDFIRMKTTATAPVQPPQVPEVPMEVVEPLPVPRPAGAASQPQTLRPTVADIDLDSEEDDLDVELGLGAMPIPPFLRNVPPAWVDTIRNDMEAQKHSPSQPPLSHGFRTLFPPK